MMKQTFSYQFPDQKIETRYSVEQVIINHLNAFSFTDTDATKLKLRTPNIIIYSVIISIPLTD